MWPLLSDKTGHTFQPDYEDSEEPIQVVQEFDPQLKFVTFTVHRVLETRKMRMSIIINIHPPPPQRVLFKIRACKQIQ